MAIKPVVKKGPATFFRRPIITVTYKGRFSLKKMRKIIKEQQKAFQKKKINGLISVNALFPSEKGASKWRYLAKFQDINEDINLEDDEVFEDYFGKTYMTGLPDKFPAFQLVIMKQGPKRGGYDNNNDCFYNCLKQVIPDVMQKVFPSPALLKQHCGLDRKDLFPVEKIPMVEEKLPDYKINVLGEHKHISMKDAKFTITLRLCYNHYTVHNQAERTMKGGRIPTDEKQVIVFRYLPGNKNVKIFTQGKIGVMNYETFRDHKSRPITSPYLFIKSSEGKMKDTYASFVKEADFLKETTNGVYNLYKSGNLKRAARHRFIELNQTLIPESLTPQEDEWISNASIGALIWAENGYEGEAWEYDFNSAYSYVLRDQKFMFPIKRGTFKTLTNEEFQKLKFFEFGIYRAEVRNADRRLFKTNRRKYYTHYDLTRAKELGYEIKLIEDGYPNCLLYLGAETKVNGNVAFGKYVSELYELKKKYPNESVFKVLLNILWGALCEKNRFKMFASSSKTINIEETNTQYFVGLRGEDPAYPDEYIVSGIHEDCHYDTPFARLAPFLLSRTRCLLSRVIEPNIDNIVRVHTDGFFSSKKLHFQKPEKFANNKLEFVKIGTDIGNLKEKHFDHIRVEHVNKIQTSNRN